MPPKLAEAIARGLDRDPSRRFASSWQWRETLRDALTGAPRQEAVAASGRREGTLVDLRPGHGAPEVDTVPVAVAAGGGGSTTPAETMQRTAPLVPGAEAAPGPPPRAIGQFPPARGTESASTLNVRIPGGVICAAGILMLASIFLPWGSVGQGPGRTLGVEFRSGALVAVAAVALFLAGLRLWRTRRRWVAAVVSAGTTVIGIAGVGLATYELVRLGDPSNGGGLFLLLGSSLATAGAGYRAQGRLAAMRRRERHPQLRTV